MRELEADPGGGRLHALDAAAAEARSVARRTGRLGQLVGALDESGLAQLAAAQLEAAERMLEALEEGRAQERLRLRRLLRGEAEESSA